MSVETKTDGDWTMFSDNELDLMVRVDYVRCGSPVQWLDPRGEWSSTPWQTADVRHLSAAQLLDKVNEFVGDGI